MTGILFAYTSQKSVRYMKQIVLILFCLLFLSTSIFCQSPTLGAIINKLEGSIQQLSNYQFDFSSRERFSDGYTEGSGTVQLYFDPVVIKMIQTAPLKDTELLYDSSKDKDKILVKPKGLPKGLLLSPNAPKIRKHSHHSILDIGFQNVLDFLKHSQTVYGDQFEQMVTVQPAKTLDGKSCLLLSINLTDEAVTEQITIEQTTSLQELAKQRHISEYKIMELNNLKSYRKITAGTTLKLPKHYAHSIDLFLDNSTFLPITQIIYDESGLLEHYDYRNIKTIR